jgi:hypothetical protein
MGHIFTNFAGDDHFRYCKTCLKGGYQAVLSQFDIFERCPIHDEPFLDRCACCGKNAPRFAWTSFARCSPSFTCGHCCGPLAGGADLDSRPETWAIPRSLATIQSFHTWAIAAQERVELVRPASWITCAPRPDSDRRAALARVLAELDQCMHKSYFRETEIDLLQPVSMRATGAPSHDCSYPKIAAETLPPSAFGSWTWTGWRKVNRDLAVPVEMSVSVEHHAAYIWRSQFEDVDAIGFSCPVYQRKRSDSFYEWWANLPTTGRRLFMNEQLCSMLARAAWRAALRTALAWRTYIEVAPPGQRLIAIDRDWLLRLGRWDLNVASPLGHAFRPTPSGFDDLFLFVG